VVLDPYLRGLLNIWYNIIIIIIIIIIIFIDLFIPSRKVLLEKLTGFQVDKKIPALYGTRRHITAVTSACHLSLS
jgi:hypothetical protein